MPNRFRPLLNAIVDDNFAGARALLKIDAGLASKYVESAHYKPEIFHWVYVGDTPLHIAAAGYRVRIARLLLESGADPRAAKNHRHSQPLHYACDALVNSGSYLPNRQIEMIQLLLDAGADIHARDANGATGLHRAVRTRAAAAVKFLLDSGADPTLQNKPGSTAFHLAVQNTGRGGSGAEPARTAQREIIRLFLDRGVSPTLKDGKGKSVLDWARSDWIRKILSAAP